MRGMMNAQHGARGRGEIAREVPGGADEAIDLRWGDSVGRPVDKPRDRLDKGPILGFQECRADGGGEVGVRVRWVVAAAVSEEEGEETWTHQGRGEARRGSSRSRREISRCPSTVCLVSVCLGNPFLRRPWRPSW
jgi:hypothetical protein